MTNLYEVYNVTVTGTPTLPTPDQAIDLLGHGTVSNGKAWRARARTDEIIMSPLARGQCILSYTNGQDVIDPGFDFSMQHNSYNCALFPQGPKYGQTQINGLSIDDASFNVTGKANRSFKEAGSPYDYGWDDNWYVKSTKGRLLSLPFKNDIITSCLADANRGTIDVLTTMAELPETVKSILDGLKVMIRLYRDCRTKAFRIYNKAKGQSNSATLAKNMKEAADAVANVWLNYRYNIQPNLLTIEDAIKTLQYELKEFVRFRETSNGQPEWEVQKEGWTYSNNVQLVDRTLIKRLIDITVDFPKFKHLMLSNVVVTGYELLPFSFVWEWFWNMGDVIAALFVNPDFSLEGSTYSWQLRGVESFTHDESQSRVDSEIRAYRREVINPRSLVRLNFKVDLNFVRSMDAIALAWSVFKKSFKN